MAPAKIVQTRGGWPFFEVDVTAAKRILRISRRWLPHLRRPDVPAVRLPGRPGGPPR